jgi:tetratricopeptide (TPR) repeat protein
VHFAIGCALAFVVGCALDVLAWLLFALLASKPPMPSVPVLCAGLFVPAAALSFVAGTGALALFGRRRALLGTLTAPHLLVVAVLGSWMVPLSTHALSPDDAVGAWAIFTCVALSIPAGLLLAWKVSAMRARTNGHDERNDAALRMEAVVGRESDAGTTRIPKWAWVLGCVAVVLAAVFFRRHQDSPQEVAWREYLTVIQRDEHPMTDAERLRRMDAAIALDPGKASYHAKRAELLVALRQLPEAHTELTRTLALAPDLQAMRILRGQVACELHDYRRAIADFDDAIAASPDRPAVHGARAIALVAEGRVGDASADLDRVLADPRLRSLDGRYERAVVWIAQGRGDLAITELDRLIAQQVSDPNFFWMRARALEQVGDRLAARADRRHALNVGGSTHLCADPFSGPASTATLVEAVASARRSAAHAVVLRAPYAETQRSPSAIGSVVRPLRVQGQGRGYAEVDLDLEVAATTLDTSTLSAPTEVTLVDASGSRRGTLFETHARCTSPCGGGAGMTCHAVATYVFNGRLLDDDALALVGDHVRVRRLTNGERRRLEAPAASSSERDFNDAKAIEVPTHQVTDADGRAVYVGTARWREQTYPAILFRHRGWQHEWIAPTYPSVCVRE